MLFIIFEIIDEMHITEKINDFKLRLSEYTLELLAPQPSLRSNRSFPCRVISGFLFRLLWFKKEVLVS